MPSRSAKAAVSTSTRAKSKHPLNSARIYRFTIEAGVDADHVAYDDPEWVADAAAGALTNEYGIECIYEHIEEAGEEANNG